MDRISQLATELGLLLQALNAVVVVAKLHFLLAGRAVAGRVERQSLLIQQLSARIQELEQTVSHD